MFITVPLLLFLIIVSRGVVLGLVYGLPVLGDVWYALYRDRRRRYTPFLLTRAVTRLMFGRVTHTQKPPALTSSVPYSSLEGEKRVRVRPNREMRREVWRRDGGVCRICRCTDGAAMALTGEHLQYDHIIPFSRNGADTVANMQLLCGPCNRRKSSRFPGQE
jgi:HNH endonuclease